MSNKRERKLRKPVQDVLSSADANSHGLGHDSNPRTPLSLREPEPQFFTPATAIDDNDEGFQQVLGRSAKKLKNKVDAQSSTGARTSSAIEKGKASVDKIYSSTSNCKSQSKYKPRADAAKDSTTFSKVFRDLHNQRAGHNKPSTSASQYEKSRSHQTTLQPPTTSMQPNRDYQRLTERPTTDGGRSSPEPLTQMFNFQPDNPARAAFRRREKATGQFSLHKKVIEIEPDQNRLERFLMDLEIQIGSFVQPPQTPQDRELKIWGNPKQVLRTQDELKDWICRSEGPTTRRPLGKEKFGQERSTITDRYLDDQREIVKKAEIARFQQLPDPDQVFPYRGAYLWPVEDVMPQEIFGPNLEAFDKMRFDLKSHIVFDHKSQAFQLYTNDEESISKALTLIEGTLREFHARNAAGGRPSSLLLIDPPERKISGTSVRMEMWSSPTEPTQARIPVMTGGVLNMRAKTEWASRSEEIENSNAIKIQETLQLAFPVVKFHRGQISMKVSFGTFALTQFKWPKNATSVPFEDFYQNVTGKGTKGKLINDLRLDRDASEILSEIYSLTSILKPHDSTTESLRDVNRIYGARFEINRFQKAPMQLEVEMHNSIGQQGLFEKRHSVWTRLDRKENVVPIDISMLQLEDRASWKLQVRTENQLDKSRIDQQLVDFADSIRIKASKANAELDGRNLFDWGPALKPSVFEQKISFRYRFTLDQSFEVEIARYDSYDLSSSSKTSSTTHWGASMWNSDWEFTLSKNAGLGLGECADWDPRPPAFFPNLEPSDGNNSSHNVESGVEAFLQHVRIVAESLGKIRGVA